MKNTNHFIALVPMAGNYEGKIAQHSTVQDGIYAAIEWAKKRFNRPFVVVAMKDGELSLPINEGVDIYNTNEKIMPYEK